MRRVLLLFFCLLTPLISVAEQKRFTVGPMVNRLESLGKGLLDDGVSYGFRMGYNLDEHMAVELGYDYLNNFTQLTVPGKPATNGHQLMANFLYNVKDDRGFIPYMMFGAGVEKYDNSRGGLKNGGIASIGLGAHFLIHEPISLRLEFKDIVRFSDAGHTFSWTFGLEYSFGKMERYVEEDVFSFAYYKIREKEDETKIASRVTTEPKKREEYRSYRSERGVASRADSALKVAKKSNRFVASLPNAATKMPAAAAVPLSASSKPMRKISVNVDGLRSGVKKAALETERKPVSKQYKRAENVIYDIDIDNTAEGIAENERYTIEREDRSVSAAVEEKEVIVSKVGGEGASKESPIEKTALSHTETLSAAAAVGDTGNGKASVKEGSETIFKTESPMRKEEALDELPCTWDSDADSIPDCKDLCKGTPKGWIVDYNGCASAISMLVNFEFDSTALNERAGKRVGELAEYLRRNRNIKVTIEGHTDSIGTCQYNFALSKRRALKVKRALVDLGISPDRIDIRAYGESRPIASNKTAAGRAENRRADALIVHLSI